MRKRRNDAETFSLSFLDCICCGFGAVILLLVISKVYEPVTIEEGWEDRDSLIAALQQELFEIRGESVILNRELVSAEQELSDNRVKVNNLSSELSSVRGEFARNSDAFLADSDTREDLQRARQELSAELQQILKDYKPPEGDTTVGGVPVDSEYVIFVIDTSPSMFQYAWPAVLAKVNEALNVYPNLKGIQVLNDEGAYMFSSYAGQWMRDSPRIRRTIMNRMRNWNPYSDSRPTEGIAEAINTFYDPTKKISIYVLGDDFARGSVEAVARFVSNINKEDSSGQRRVRIHAIGFWTDVAGNRLNFANLMRVLCEQNGGTFVAVYPGAGA